jgi:formylglycine-generating enzyme required for sulfatase activity
MRQTFQIAIVAGVAAVFGGAIGQLADAQSPPASRAAPPPAAAPPRAADSDPYAAAAGAMGTAAATVALPPAAHTEEGEPPDSPMPVASAAVRIPKVTIVHVTVPEKDGMLKLPGGRFVMGSSFAKNERPRAVRIGPYWIDRTEVTVGDYRACVDRGACARPAKTSASCTYDAGTPNLPVSCVHWRDADRYCRAVEKRLPTEAEWEFAARGMTSTPYPWGGGPGCTFAVTMVNEMPDRSCAPRPTPVGSHPSGASMFGVQDLTGNVEEWVSDWYVEIVGAGPAPRSGAAHVLRGGGWLTNPSLSRTTTRNWGSAVEAGPNVGFRCARDEAETKP